MATWPYSGRGANSIRAFVVPVISRTSEVASGAPSASSRGTLLSSQSVTVSPDQRVSTVRVPGRYRWPSGITSRPAGPIEKCPAGLPPSRSAKTAAESGLGWHSQVIFASGATSATVRPLLSSECRSIGTARSP